MPRKEKLYSDIARPLIHSGAINCAVAFRLVRVSTQKAPEKNMKTAAVAMLVERPRPIPTRPNRPIVTIGAHRWNRSMKRCRTTVATSAPTPMAPSRMPRVAAVPPMASL